MKRSRLLPEPGALPACPPKAAELRALGRQAPALPPLAGLVACLAVLRRVRQQTQTQNNLNMDREDRTRRRSYVTINLLEILPIINYH